MQERSALLQPYRVLDLSDERGHLCGQILAELGADVIKVEPPGGDPARGIGPFYQDEPHPERSLLWFAFNLNKRSVIIDLQAADGQALLKQLVGTADFLVESFAPGYLDGLGLGYQQLSALNPLLTFVSITPFGQTGPYRDYKACDLVIQALGGRVYLIGYPDRAPLRIGVPQAYLQGGIHGAVAALIALYQRHRDGLGQHVDVSMQEAAARQYGSQPLFWFYERVSNARQGNRMPRRHPLSLRRVWSCADGEINFSYYGGSFGRLAKPLIEWMIEEGMAPTVGQIDWDQLDFFYGTMDRILEMERDFENFFLKHTKQELAEQAFKRHFLLGPVNEPPDIFLDEHLLARQFFETVEHPELGKSFLFPGPPFRLTTAPIGTPRRAPLIGEHTVEVLSELSTLPTRAEGSKPATQDQRAPVIAGGSNDDDRSLAAGPLTGIKVLDFTWFLAGPLVTECMADYGAQVVRVESGKTPDIVRLQAPFKDNKPGVNRALFFTQLNSSKLSISLDLKNERAREIIRRLVSWADVVIENFRPGTMARWGLDYPELQKINPQLVMLSSSVYGQWGPSASTAGTGSDVQAKAGFVAATGWPDRPSVLPHQAYSDWIAPWYSVIAILSALDRRRRTGQGEYIEMSQYESSLPFLSLALLDYSFNGRTWQRRGNRSSIGCPHGAYPCQGEDRWCAIAVFTEEEWRSFCEVLGDPAWTRDGKFASFADRKRNEDELDELVSRWTKHLTAEDVMVKLQQAGVAAGVVNSVEDAVDKDPQLHWRRFFKILDNSETGPTLHCGWPYKFSRSQSNERSSPILGEHTHYVCTSLLGMPDEEFVRLMEEGVFV